VKKEAAGCFEAPERTHWITRKAIASPHWKPGIWPLGYSAQLICLLLHIYNNAVWGIVIKWATVIWMTVQGCSSLHAVAVLCVVDCVWNVMAHAQKPDFVFRRNGRRIRLNRLGRQFGRLQAAEVCTSAVVMLDTSCSEVVWRVLATHSIRQFPHHFPLPCVTVCHHVSTGL